MKPKALFAMGILLAATLLSCGVDRTDDPRSLGDAPDLEGDWELVLLSIYGECPFEGKGLAIQSPLIIQGVEQDGLNLSATFEAGGATYKLKGSVLEKYMVLTLERSGFFLETLAGKVKAPTFKGTFTGQELPDGCTEQGAFIGAARPLVYVDVSGLWTLTISGEASSCVDPADEGAFDKTFNNVTAISSEPGAVMATYEDPTGVTNTIAAVAIEDVFAGAIVDSTISPPTRVAALDGKIESSSVLGGNIAGELEFPGGLCEVSGTFTILY